MRNARHIAKQAFDIPFNHKHLVLIDKYVSVKKYFDENLSTGHLRG